MAVRNRRTRGRAVVVALLGCLLVALLVPALAAAAEFKVNTTEDAVDQTAGAPCETAAGKCSLRAAIEVANADATRDKITFDTPDVFDGGELSKITLSSTLPEITEPVEIDGGECPTVLTEGPCVEVDGIVVSAPDSVFDVGAGQTTISGLSILGGEDGIKVEADSVGFKATGDWFGYGLSTGFGIGGSEWAGIFLGPGADAATIGGDEAADRNVFGRSTFGLIARGASLLSIKGNYFGVKPAGPTIVPTLKVGIQIGDATGTSTLTAEDEEIGGELNSPEGATPACDGPCNVIATEGGGVGIELTGSVSEEIGSATGPTEIRGNYIGLGPDGNTAFGSAEYGIEGTPQRGAASTVGPGETTIGGVAAADANYIVGGEGSVFMTGAEKLRVEGDEIGYAADHSASEAPSDFGILVDSHAVTAGAVVSGNRINAEGAEGIENDYAGAEITDNEVVGASNGIVTRESTEGAPNTISSNGVIEADGYGIRIGNDSNFIIGNTVVDTGRVGITTTDPAEDNRIGGDQPGEANLIEGTGETSGGGEGAIVIEGREASVNEVAANEGSLNEGPFIDLQRVEPPEGPPNHGIQPPIFASTLQSSASGTAVPFAVVRIFRKASSEEGELGALLAVAHADSSGSWTATYATQPLGGLLAATQTSPLGGTSKVSAPVAASADPSGGGGGSGDTSGGGSGSSGGGSSQGPPPDDGLPPTKTVPVIKIAKGPKKSSTSTTAKFAFKATNVSGATFECKLDKAKWAACKSPKTYKKLKPGNHTFQVRAKAAGVTGAPAKLKFTIKP